MGQAVILLLRGRCVALLYGSYNIEPTFPSCKITLMQTFRIKTRRELYLFLNSPKDNPVHFYTSKAANRLLRALSFKKPHKAKKYKN